jgi:hypothetical protein
MRIFLLVVMIALLGQQAVRAAPPIELEIATERGVQITAPQEWLQLLADLGIENVRIRAARPGDVPAVENRGTAEHPRFRVSGVLTGRDELRLAGAAFSRNDRSRIKDYFARLAADGPEALTAPRGMFGLTEREIKAVFADLAQPIDFATKGKLPTAVIERLRSTFKLKIVIDADAEQTLRDATKSDDELKGLSSGTAMAMLLRRDRLVLRPEKSRGQPVGLRVEAGGSPALTKTGGPPVATASKPDDKKLTRWPIGWESERAPGALAPSLFEYLNAEIDGYTLEESLDAIAPRLKLPLYLDHAVLTASKIDPAKIQVRLERTRTIYIRVIDRVLAQAHLGSQLRVDEAGRPFLWVTR